MLKLPQYPILGNHINPNLGGFHGKNCGTTGAMLLISVGVIAIQQGTEVAPKID